MILQEKIKKKAERFGKLAPVFLEGAKFALENQWINVEDDLPCNHVELLEDCFQTKYVEACFTYSDGSNFVTIEKMVRVDVGIGKDCWVWSSNLREHVTYWKSIPKLSENRRLSYEDNKGRID